MFCKEHMPSRDKSRVTYRTVQKIMSSPYKMSSKALTANAHEKNKSWLANSVWDQDYVDEEMLGNQSVIKNNKENNGVYKMDSSKKNGSKDKKIRTENRGSLGSTSIDKTKNTGISHRHSLKESKTSEQENYNHKEKEKIRNSSYASFPNKEQVTDVNQGYETCTPNKKNAEVIHKENHLISSNTAVNQLADASNLDADATVSENCYNCSKKRFMEDNKIFSDAIHWIETLEKHGIEELKKEADPVLAKKDLEIAVLKTLNYKNQETLLKHKSDFTETGNTKPQKKRKLEIVQPISTIQKAVPFKELVSNFRTFLFWLVGSCTVLLLCCR